MEQFLLNLIRRWFWLIGLATLIAGATTYWVSAQEPTIYVGKARLIVGPGVDSLNPDLDALRTGGKLLQTYAELATTRPVLQAVINDHRLDINPDMLKKQIKVTSNEETQMLTISVQDEDPTQAAAIANTVADMLVRMSPSGAGGSELQLNDQMRNQAAVLEESIASTEARIMQLEADLIAATSAETQPLLAGKTAQEGGGGTEARIKQLEADLQAAANLNEQHLISNEILAGADNMMYLPSDIGVIGIHTPSLERVSEPPVIAFTDFRQFLSSLCISFALSGIFSARSFFSLISRTILYNSIRPSSKNSISFHWALRTAPAGVVRHVPPLPCR